MRVLSAVLLSCLWFSAIATTPAEQFQREKILKERNCFMCHAVDKKLVGPAFKDVAAKYTESDMDYLVQKIMNGGGGVWGPIPMPPNAINEEDTAQAVRWILSQ
jgi:cytochrome c